MASVNHMAHKRLFGGQFMIRVYLILESTNQNIIEQMFTASLK